ncbi:MFS transporter [Marivivens niveibacter]|uniref:MFS transporter n=1 Tax=Marivivens niveibacter TaxID=1930667 RepID=A0A251X078_9RHOB|nr:MFS transporter [Marivivens niveibacter]OUD09785.1 MFS transporter [Marivivens niveibacter]
MASVQKKRIWGWMAFDWASQPIYTLGLTFIFGPYFAAVATDYFLNSGAPIDQAKANAQSMWSLGQSVAGLVIAITAPILGAWADLSGRKIPWIAFFSVIYVVATWMLWGLTPDGSRLAFTLVIFYVGFFAAESALNFTNAILPSLGNDKEVGRISGSGAAFGYWGGVLSLFILLLFFVDTNGKTMLLELEPAFGLLDASQNEGTRAVGPFIAIWYAVFMIPFFLWVRDKRDAPTRRVNLVVVFRDLKSTIKGVLDSRSLSSFLLGSMLYRDALNALYAFGGVYATLVLDWETMQVGIFGIIGAITAAIATYIGGRFDQKIGPKPVIKTTVSVLVLVCIVIVSMNREHIGPIALAPGSNLPDIIFLICGSAIGGAGGALYASSRSMMVRHTDPSRPAEAFGLFALTGKATAFLAPMLIGIVTYLTGNVQLGFVPVIVLFLLGMLMLRWVNSEGDRAEWSAH